MIGFVKKKGQRNLEFEMKLEKKDHQIDKSLKIGHGDFFFIYSQKNSFLSDIYIYIYLLHSL